MKYSNFGGYRFSQLTLGTVQLGLNYGVSNNEGVPGTEESRGILQAALNSGINTLDTARQYGSSEAVIGDFLERNGKSPQVNLVSKFKISPQNLHHPERAWREVVDSVKTSLATLKITELPVCLLHKGEEPIRDVMQVLPGIIRRLKEQGLISIGGISAFFPGDVHWFLDSEEIEATQVPLSILDQRLIHSGLLNSMSAAGKLVFARSIFLQGLFFMESADLKGNLIAAENHLKQLRQLADLGGMSVAQLAFSFVRDLPGVNSIVFGAINEAQVHENVRLLNGKPVPKALIEKAMELFENVDEDLITPGRWKLN